MSDYKNDNFNEYGKIPSNTQPSELGDYNERKSYCENPTSDVSTKDDTSSSSQLSKLLPKILTGAVATVTLGVTVVNPIVNEVSAKDIDVQLLEIGAESDDLYYTFSVTSEIPLTVNLTNANTNRTSSLSEENSSGVFENLQPGLKYTLSVVCDGLVGDKQLFSKDFTMPKSYEDTEIQLLSYEVIDNSISFSLSVSSEFNTYAILETNGDTAVIPLSNGQNEGIFSNLNYGTTYTFLIMEERLSGDVEVITQSSTIPHPIEFATAEIAEANVDGNAIYFTANVDSDVPLRAIVFQGEEYYSYDLENGYNEGDFSSLTEGATYTLSIVGDDNNGEVTLATTTVTIPHPIDFAVAEILELYADVETLSVQYFISVESDVTLRAVLTDGQDVFTKTLENGDNSGEFSTLNSNNTYTLSIVGEGYEGEVVITSEQVYFE